METNNNDHNDHAHTATNVPAEGTAIDSPDYLDTLEYEVWLGVCAATPEAWADVVPTDAAYRYGLRLAVITDPNLSNALAWSFDGFAAVDRDELADLLVAFAETVRTG